MKTTAEISPVAETLESLKEALSRAKFSRLLAESALSKAKAAVVSAEVDIKVQVAVIERIEREIADAIGAGVAAGDDMAGVVPSSEGSEVSGPITVFEEGVEIGRIRFFYMSSVTHAPWSAFCFPAGRVSRHFSVFTRKEAEQAVRDYARASSAIAA